MKYLGPVMLQVVGVPLGLLVAAGLAWWWSRIIPDYRPQVWEIVAVVLMMILILPVHEMLHALVHPTWGRDSIIGVWPTRLLCYAHYNGEMTRGRMLLLLAMPLLVLTVLPLAWALVAKQTTIAFGFLSFLNMCGAGGDLVGLAVVWWRVPSGARIFNDGVNTYYNGGKKYERKAV